MSTTSPNSMRPKALKTPFFFRYRLVALFFASGGWLLYSCSHHVIDHSHEAVGYLEKKNHFEKNLLQVEDNLAAIENRLRNQSPLAFIEAANEPLKKIFPSQSCTWNLESLLSYCSDCPLETLLKEQHTQIQQEMVSSICLNGISSLAQKNCLTSSTIEGVWDLLDFGSTFLWNYQNPLLSKERCEKRLRQILVYRVCQAYWKACAAREASYKTGLVLCQLQKLQQQIVKKQHEKYLPARLALQIEEMAMELQQQKRTFDEESATSLSTILRYLSLSGDDEIELISLTPLHASLNSSLCLDPLLLEKHALAERPELKDISTSSNGQLQQALDVCGLNPPPSDEANFQLKRHYWLETSLKNAWNLLAFPKEKVLPPAGNIASQDYIHATISSGILSQIHLSILAFCQTQETYQSCKELLGLKERLLRSGESDPLKIAHLQMENLAAECTLISSFAQMQIAMDRISSSAGIAPFSSTLLSSASTQLAKDLAVDSKMIASTFQASHEEESSLLLSQIDERWPHHQEMIQKDFSKEEAAVQSSLEYLFDIFSFSDEITHTVALESEQLALANFLEIEFISLPEEELIVESFPAFLSQEQLDLEAFQASLENSGNISLTHKEENEKNIIELDFLRLDIESFSAQTDFLFISEMVSLELEENPLLAFYRSINEPIFQEQIEENDEFYSVNRLLEEAICNSLDLEDQLMEEIYTIPVNIPVTSLHSENFMTDWEAISQYALDNEEHFISMPQENNLLNQTEESSPWDLVNYLITKRIKLEE